MTKTRRLLTALTATGALTAAGLAAAGCHQTNAALICAEQRNTGEVVSNAFYLSNGYEVMCFLVRTSDGHCRSVAVNVISHGLRHGGCTGT